METHIKPIQTSPQATLGKTIISLLAFIAVYYIIFDQDLSSVFTIVLALIIHESGHYLAMKHYGYTDVQMMFMPFLGAFVTGEKEKTTQKQKVIVILSGPIPGIIIGLGIKVLSIVYDLPFLTHAANVFIFLNAFNLLPISPFDGGRLVEALFTEKKDLIQILFLIISILVLTTLAFYLESYFILIFGILLFIRVRMIWKTRSIRKSIADEHLLSKSYTDLSDEEYFKIKETVLKNLPELNKNTTKESDIISVVKSVLVDKTDSRINLAGRLFIIVLWISSLVIAPIANLLM